MLETFQTPQSHDFEIVYNGSTYRELVPVKTGGPL